MSEEEYERYRRKKRHMEEEEHRIELGIPERDYYISTHSRAWTLFWACWPVVYVAGLHRIFTGRVISGLLQLYLFLITVLGGRNGSEFEGDVNLIPYPYLNLAALFWGCLIVIVIAIGSIGFRRPLMGKFALACMCLIVIGLAGLYWILAGIPITRSWSLLVETNGWILWLWCVGPATWQILDIIRIYRGTFRDGGDLRIVK